MIIVSTRSLKTRINKILRENKVSESTTMTTAIRGFSPTTSGFTYEFEAYYDKTSPQYLTWNWHYTTKTKPEDTEQKVQRMYNLLAEAGLSQFIANENSRIRLLM